MIILMGLAGSGKSTQGKILAEATGRVWLSAGQVLRDTDNETVHVLQRQGELVPDEITISLMDQAIAAAKAAGKDVVLDGYPRTLKQATWIAEHLADQIELVLRIVVPKQELITRMKLRGRADDLTPEAIEERFRIVDENNVSICKLLAAHGVKLRALDGTGTVEEVSQRVKQVMTEVDSE